MKESCTSQVKDEERRCGKLVKQLSLLNECKNSTKCPHTKSKINGKIKKTERELKLCKFKIKRTQKKREKTNERIDMYDIFF